MAARWAVIGAGAAGLAAARALAEAGVEVVVFEAGSHVGGLWVYDNDSGASPAYRSLHINSEAKASGYSAFPFPEDAPFYPTHREMAAYFRAFAERFRLLRLIRFGSRVAAVEPRDGGGFTVRLADGTAEDFEAVVVASGHQQTPRPLTQAEGFTGRLVYSRDYRSPEAFAGQRVLVVGVGNSGMDIAADLCTIAARTVISARSPVLIMPRMMFGLPNSRTLMKLEQPWLPWRLRVWLRNQLVGVFHGRMEQWGFRTPKRRTHPISHPTLISQIAWRRIAVKPGLEGVEGDVARFADGSEEGFDAIIAATGYRTALPFLPDALSPVTGDRLDLYLRMIPPDRRGLYFVGFFDTWGPNIPVMERQAEHLAALATGRLALPSPEAMRATMAAERAWYARQFPDAPRYGLELDPRHYGKLLARDLARLSPGRA